jgi:glycosyltransferase involved in cell wall biosynthesis
VVIDEFPSVKAQQTSPPEQLSTTGAKRLCVVQVVGTFGGGGAERMAWNLALGLAELGHDSRALAIKKAGGYAAASDAGSGARVSVHELGVASGAMKPVVAGIFEFRRWLREMRPDLLHIHGSGSLPFVMAALLGVSSRPRVVFTWHDSGNVLEGSGWRRGLAVASLRRCDRVYGSSVSVCDRLNSALGWVGSKAAVVMSNGVPARSPIEEECDPPRIAWLGRFVPDKDPQCLVKACATLKAEGLQFRVVLAGSAPAAQRWYFEQTQDLISRLGLADVIEMPGWIDDVGGLLDHSAICVQSSHTEGLSMTLLEAMMAGACAVATDVGDTACVVRDGETGLLVRPGDEESLTGALRRVLADSGLRARLGAAARTVAAREHTLTAAAKRVARDYAELIAR